MFTTYIYNVYTQLYSDTPPYNHVIIVHHVTSSGQQLDRRGGQCVCEGEAAVISKRSRRCTCACVVLSGNPIALQ